MHQVDRQNKILLLLEVVIQWIWMQYLLWTKKIQTLSPGGEAAPKGSESMRLLWLRWSRCFSLPERKIQKESQSDRVGLRPF